MAVSLPGMLEARSDFEVVKCLSERMSGNRNFCCAQVRNGTVIISINEMPTVHGRSILTSFLRDNILGVAFISDFNPGHKRAGQGKEPVNLFWNSPLSHSIMYGNDWFIGKGV